AASVGYQLGQMVSGHKFFRPTAVFLDGDCKAGTGCHVLPGEDAPERTVFQSLKTLAWRDTWTRVKRSISDVSAACEGAMLLGDHHDWTEYAAKQLAIAPTVLWHALCGEWAEKSVSEKEARALATYIEDRIAEYR
ncbi:MAG TPA: hypothetical protein VKG91_01565, partial [Roseiarcus sp.]|nr:hypothetical protein [Roseiarcus sp.]